MTLVYRKAAESEHEGTQDSSGRSAEPWDGGRRKRRGRRGRRRLTGLSACGRVFAVACTRGFPSIPGVALSAGGWGNPLLSQYGCQLSMETLDHGVEARGPLAWLALRPELMRLRLPLPPVNFTFAVLCADRWRCAFICVVEEFHCQSKVQEK